MEESDGLAATTKQHVAALGRARSNVHRITLNETPCAAYVRFSRLFSKTHGSNGLLGTCMRECRFTTLQIRVFMPFVVYHKRILHLNIDKKRNETGRYYDQT